MQINLFFRNLNMKKKKVSKATNIFFIGLASYTHLTRDVRVKENRAYMKKVIEKEVYNQIEFVMPKESGGVIK